MSGRGRYARRRYSSSSDSCDCSDCCGASSSESACSCSDCCGNYTSSESECDCGRCGSGSGRSARAAPPRKAPAKKSVPQAKAPRKQPPSRKSSAQYGRTNRRCAHRRPDTGNHKRVDPESIQESEKLKELTSKMADMKFNQSDKLRKCGKKH